MKKTSIQRNFVIANQERFCRSRLALCYIELSLHHRNTRAILQCLLLEDFFKLIGLIFYFIWILSLIFLIYTFNYYLKAMLINQGFR